MQDWPALHYWRTEQLSPFSNQGEMGAFHQNATAKRYALQWKTKPFILASRDGPS
jgi:ethanolamine ammonia-lyase large subunit